MTKGGGTLGRSLLIPFSFMPKKQKPLQKKGFSFGAEKGIRPAILGQYRRQPGELKNHSPDGFLPRLARPFPSHPFLFYAQKAKTPSKEGIFLWRRERDSSGDTGAVSPPARGTKKPFTGWFFASPCSAVPFSSLSLLCLKKQKSLRKKGFSFGAEKGIRTLVTVPRKHDFQSCALDQLSHLCKPLDYNTPFCVALQAKICIYAAKGFIA